MIQFDANALMMASQFRIDLFRELRELTGAFEPVVLNEVVQELRGIARGNGRHAAAARVGLTLSEQCRIIESGEGSGTVDERIAGYAECHGGMVVTNDRELRDFLLSKNIPVISLKNKKKLGIFRS
jgi:uncharacterized protein